MQLFTENHRKSGGKSSLSDYYSAAYGAASFDKSLRQRVVFSDHSLVTDAVFAEMHLISCRNVLIYFDRDLQDRALGLFKDSLARKGFLGLGAKESLRFSAHADAFHGFRARGKNLPEAGRMTGAGLEAVVIGASAGALEALSAILPRLPADFGLPVIIVVHVPPDKKSMLAELFQDEMRDRGARGRGQGADRRRHGLFRAARLSSAGRDGQNPVAVQRRAGAVIPAHPSTCCSKAPPTPMAPDLIAIVLTGANQDGAKGLKAVVAGRRHGDRPKPAEAPLRRRCRKRRWRSVPTPESCRSTRSPLYLQGAEKA